MINGDINYCTWMNYDNNQVVGNIYNDDIHIILERIKKLYYNFSHCPPNTCINCSFFKQGHIRTYDNGQCISDMLKNMNFNIFKKIY